MYCNVVVLGECIFNVEFVWFEFVEGCYYFVGIYLWKVLEVGLEDWIMLEKVVCYFFVLVIGEVGLDCLGLVDILL